MSRPSSYNEQTAEALCEAIARGGALHRLCEEDGNPHEATVYRCLEKVPAFREMYARARERQQDYEADRMIEIADTEPDPQRARVMIDARKWRASKLAPKKYGDRLEVEGLVEHRFVARIPEPAANASEWLADQKPKQIEGMAVSSPHGETGEKISKPR